MSHYFALGAGRAGRSGAGPFNAPALAWHRDFARAAKAHGYELIWSLSLRDARHVLPGGVEAAGFDGERGGDRLGAAVDAAVAGQCARRSAYLGADRGGAGRRSAGEAGLRAAFQVGEPWWWVTPDGRLCLYDDAARAALGGDAGRDRRRRGGADGGAEGAARRGGRGAGGVDGGARGGGEGGGAGSGDACCWSICRGCSTRRRPRCGAPTCRSGWAAPAFDVLQLEDYDWVTGGRTALRAAAYARSRRGSAIRVGRAALSVRLRRDGRTTARSGARSSTPRARREARGVAEVFVWALPQVLRDGLTLFGEEQAM